MRRWIIWHGGRCWKEAGEQIVRQRIAWVDASPLDMVYWMGSDVCKEEESERRSTVVYSLALYPALHCVYLGIGVYDAFVFTTFTKSQGLSSG